MLNLIEQTLSTVYSALEKYRSPALLVSFGKDSMVMLHLLSKLKLPVILHSTPFQSWKWKFARETISAMNLTVHTFPPEWVALQDRPNGSLYVASAYTAGDKSKRVIYHRTAEQSQNMPLVCGLHDVLRQPKGTICGQWDLMICGQKTGDPGVDGVMEIKSDLAQSGDGVDTMFPLRHWTDEDIFDYTTANKIPYQRTRYRADYITHKFEELRDVSDNPDVIDACFACLKKDGPKTVKCPRLGGMEISNIADKVARVAMERNVIA